MNKDQIGLLIDAVEIAHMNSVLDEDDLIFEKAREILYSIPEISEREKELLIQIDNLKNIISKMGQREIDYLRLKYFESELKRMSKVVIEITKEREIWRKL